ncbi:flagellar biosynthesis protein [Cupriavidus sp. RAF12]|uniref:flagellar biosynthesis protein n=1 Tax=Cupriavidus sp. RAF12 TaxID=3233050 RepID=UPI003F9074E5
MLIARLLAYAAAASIVAGCAVGRDTIDVPAPHGNNPASGKLVRIESVLDKREFQAAPPSADIASLDPDEDTGEGSKARAIGRKRNTYGKALGDVVLPEGKTVSGLVEGAITTAFQQSGYVVVHKGEEGYDRASPVSAQVTDFWAWFAPGFWSVSTNHKSEVQITGNVGALSGEKIIKTRVSESKQVVTSSDWREIVEKGLSAIAEQTKKIIAP